MRRITSFNKSNNRSNRSNTRSFRKERSQYAFSMLGAIVRTLIGFFCIVPFAWQILFAKPEPVMSLFALASIMLLIIGGPLFIVGLIGIAGKRFGNSSQTEMDIARIRFAAETQLMHDLFKGKK